MKSTTIPTRAFPGLLLAVTLWLSAGSVTSASSDAEQAELDEIEACVASNTPRSSTVQSLTLVVEKKGRETFRSALTLYWLKLDDGERRIVMRFREPEDLAQAGLHVEARPRARPKVHIYMPEQGRPRSVQSRGELEGFLGRANLGIEELELLLEPLAERDASLLDASALLDGRPVWILEEQLADEGDREARFERLVLFVDRELCIPVRAEFHDEKEKLAKVMKIDPKSVTRIVESWIPSFLTFSDLERETETVLYIDKAEVDVPLSPALLTVEALPMLNR